ncbi:MAG: hypothetical protein ACM3U1_08420 [Chloroflexota bacterium]
MKIVKVKEAEGCLESTNAKDLLFDGAITEELVRALAEFSGGKLIIRRELAKPFFRILARGKFTLQGSLSNKTARLYLPENSTGEDELSFLYELLTKYSAKQSDN